MKVKRIGKVKRSMGKMSDKIKGVELKSPLSIKFVIKLCVGAVGLMKKKKTTVSNNSHFMIKNNKPLQNKGGRV
jgi:hypothetical protein